MVNNPLQCRRLQFDSWIGKIPWRRDRLPTTVLLGFPCGSAGKESACRVEDLGLIPGLWRFPGGGKGYPLRYSGLENSMYYIAHGASLVTQMVKGLPAIQEIPGLGIYSGEGNGNPLQQSCLGNPMVRRTWKVTVHDVAKSMTDLSDFTFTYSSWGCKDLDTTE